MVSSVAHRRVAWPRASDRIFVLVDLGEPTDPHHGLAGNDHIADVPSAQAEQPVAGDGVGRQRRGRVVVEDGDVGGRTRFDPTECRFPKERAATAAPIASRASGHA